jgi:hypothetical protein
LAETGLHSALPLTSPYYSKSCSLGFYPTKNILSPSKNLL